MAAGMILAKYRDRLLSMRLLIATPFYKREAYTNYIASLLPSIQALNSLGINYEWTEVSGDAYVDRAKNSIVAHFLSGAYTDLIMIDSDLGWDLEGFLRLLIADKELVAGLYPMKHDGSYALQLPPGPLRYTETGLIEAVWLPGGFVHFQRSCLEKLTNAHSHDYYEDSRAGFKGRTVNLYCCPIYEGRRYGEDVEFCRKWNTAGGKVYLEPRIRFDHVGSNVTSGCYADVIDKGTI